jgi:lysophospholipid acyltransferase (LPLAT)-like uncharacterized protein
MARPIHRLAGPGALLLKALLSTYRIKELNSEIGDAVYSRGEVPIYCSWHQRWFSGINYLAWKNSIAIMVSQSRDGEIISKMITSLGWNVVRGSSSSGGTRALRELLVFLKKGTAVAHIVDGPRGPFGEIKPGLLSLAQISGMPIVPLIAAPERKWTFNSWDRFMIPKPFSRIIIRYDKEIYVPRRLSEDDAEDLRKHIEKRLHVLYEETDALWN